MILRPGAPAWLAAVLLAFALTARAAPAGAARSIAIPGTSLSLGMRLTRVDSLAAFRGARPSGPNRRSGPTRFFGIDANATLEFQAGYLTHARFEMQDVSTHSRDYAEDQLRRLGLKPMCDRLDDGAHECDWNGACLLHVSWAPGKLTADARAPEGWTAVEAPAPAGASPPPTDTSPAPAGATPAATAAPPASAGATTAGAGAAAPAGIAALTPAPPVVTTTGSSAMPPGAHPAARGDGPSTALAMLGDTLFIGYPPDLSRSHRARTQVPPPDPIYPEAARNAGVQGVVRLLATVNARGMVSKTDIVHSIPELDRAAADATRNCRFVPLGPPGMPEGFQVMVQVRFTR
jgi:TonB family protein